MQEVIKNFINYLNQMLEAAEVRSRILQIAVKNEMVLENERYIDVVKAELQLIIRNLNVPCEQWKMRGEVFTCFDSLSTSLLKSPLSHDEQVQVLFYMLEKNIATGLLKEKAEAFDVRKIKDYKFQNISTKEAEKAIIDDTYRQLMLKNENELNEKERLLKQEIFDFTESNPLDISDIIERHRKVQEHYFDKIPNMTREDSQIVQDVLAEFGVNKTMLKFTRNYISRKCNFNSQSIKIQVTPEKSVVQESKEEMISSKEYNRLKRELGMYFNLDEMNVKDELSLEKQVYCVYLMKQMSLSDDRIAQVLRKIKKARKNREQHPIEQFIYLLNKLEYYSYIPDVKNRLEELKDCFKAIFIIDDESYILYKEYMELLLTEILKFMPDGYEYEYHAADFYVKSLK